MACAPPARGERIRSCRRAPESPATSYFAAQAALDEARQAGGGAAPALIDLGVAESFPALRPALSANGLLQAAAEAASRAAVEGTHAGYTSFEGDEACRAAVAAAMQRHVYRLRDGAGAGGHSNSQDSAPFPGRGVVTEDVVLACGATAAVEALLFALCDPGDCVVVPAPCYPAFFVDATRAEVQLAPTAPEASISREALEEAARGAEGRGLRVRGVLLTSPCNPTGRLHAREEVQAVCDWADARGAFVLWDAVYAGTAADESAAAQSVPRPSDPARLHTVWGISKDFGLSGWRVGAIHTRDEGVREALRVQARWMSASRLAQAAVAAMLEDGPRLEAALREGAALLAARAALGRRTLLECGVPAEALSTSAPGAGPLDFVDASLQGKVIVDEERMWRRALELGVSVVRGEGCLAAWPGGVRVCWGAAESDDVLREGARRLARAICEAIDEADQAPQRSPSAAQVARSE